jgi:uncharacterized protein YjdB
VGKGEATITVTTQDGGKTATCKVTVNTLPVDDPGDPGEPIVYVTSISLNITSVTLNLTGAGSSTQLTASVLPSGATNKAYNWNSSDTRIATVTNGQVNAVAAGDAVIYVTTVDGGKSASCSVKVQGPATPGEVRVTGVSLDKSTLTIDVGSSGLLVATVRPTDPIPNNTNVTWSTSDSAVAVVSNGTVFGRGRGVANITVTTSDGGFKDTCLVTVEGEAIAVTSIGLKNEDGYAVTDDMQIVLREGNATTLDITVGPPEATIKELSFRSSLTTVATITGSSTSCAIITRGQGTTTITISSVSDPAVKVTFTVKVDPPDPNAVHAEEVRVTPSRVILDIGETTTLTAIVLPVEAVNKYVTWKSEAPGVAEVDDNGAVIAKTAGTTTITVTTLSGGHTAECEVTVRNADVPNIPVTGVTLDRTALLIDIPEGPITLTATVEPEEATDKGVSWTSSNESVVTLVDNEDSTATITPVGYGPAIIYVTTVSGGKIAICTVTVEDLSGPENPYVPRSITLNETQVELYTDITFQLSVTFEPNTVSPGNRTITWTSSNRSVATVSNTGQVSAIAKGITLIQATTMNNRIATCAVIVSDPPSDNEPVVGISMSRSAVEVPVGETVTLTVTFVPANAANKGLTWRATGENASQILGVAPGSEPGTGVVSGLRAGTATVTATSDDGNKVASCTVTVTQQADFYIRFDDITNVDPNIEGFPQLSLRSTSPLVLSLANPTQYTSVSWEVTLPSVKGTGTTFEINASDFVAFGEGRYYIYLEVERNGRKYSKNITLVLVE